MKKIIKYFGIVLSIALAGVLTGCNPQLDNDTADLGLGIKVFFPTKVVAGQPMTVNGSGFMDAREIVFPDGVVVTSFEIVSDEMIRVTAPAGISSSGGNLIVRTADDEAVSSQELTLGRTSVSGFSKQDGEDIQGGEQLTIFGKDLEFIKSVELPDPDGNPFILEDVSFYRKGTSSVIITLPKQVFEGTYKGNLYTYDGQVIPLPELNYTPAPDDSGGHWEIVKTTIWENDGTHGAINWGGEYRFGLDGNDGLGECLTTFPEEIWNQLKTGTFYVLLSGDSPQIRVTTGWWSTTWTGEDIFAGNDHMTDNGDGTFTLEVNFDGDPILDFLDVQHLLFTGGGYTPLEIYFEEEIWIDGDDEPVAVVFWENDGTHGAVNWGGEYRFGLDGNDGLGECLTTFPQEVWDHIKSGSFFMDAQGSDWVQMRITTGWWSTTWTGEDITTGNERIIDNGDGTYTIEINFEGDPILDVLDVQHLLFTGGGYTPLRFYYYE